MKELINQLLKLDLTFNQFKTILFLICNHSILEKEDFNITISKLAEYLEVDVKSLIKDLKMFPDNITENIFIEVKDKEIDIKINTLTFTLINNTRSKLKTKSVVRKKEVEEVFSYWQEMCNKKRAKLDNKREKVINNALDTYGMETVKKAIEGCSKTLWNMGYDKFGNPVQNIYNELSLIFRNIEYVERFTNNSLLPTLEEQIESLQMPSKNALVQSRDTVDSSRTNWKEERLGLFDND